MEIPADAIKELRQRTGVGVMDCKKALAESAGNVDDAIGLLRKKGLAKAAKRVGRATAEGLITAYIHPGSKIGVLVDINCKRILWLVQRIFKICPKKSPCILPL